MIIRCFLLILFTHALALGSSSALAAKQLPVLDRMVASVNNDSITESELSRQTQMMIARLNQSGNALPPQEELRKQLLERMVLEKLQLQLAEKEGIEVDEPTVDKALDDIASRDNLTLAQLKQALEEQGVPFTQFRNTIKTEMTLSKLHQKEVGQYITISSNDVNHFLNSPAAQDQTGTEFRLAHILIPLPESPTPEKLQDTQKNAETLVQKLKAGADFAQTAIAKSAGQQALSGGDLGYRKVATIPTLFAKIITNLKVGDIYGPIHDASGFHIIKLVDKKLSGDSATEKTHTETHVRQILINTTAKYSDEEAKALLNKLKAEIAAGAPFAKVAQKHSEETSSAAKGGDLGWVTPARVVPEFNQQMATLKIGAVSEPFKTDLGWHLIQVMEKRTQQTSSDAMRNKAMDILYQRKFDEQLVSWLRRLRAEAEVVIYPEK